MKQDLYFACKIGGLGCYLKNLYAISKHQYLQLRYIGTYAIRSTIYK